MDGSVATGLRVECWLDLNNPNMTMDEGEAELISAGNVILERDDVNRRFKCADSTIKITPAEAVALGFPAMLEE